MKTFKQFMTEKGIVRTVDGMKKLTKDEINQAGSIIVKTSKGKQREKRLDTFANQIGLGGV